MNVDRILEVPNRHGVGYLLIGGMNFLLALPKREQKPDRIRVLRAALRRGGHETDLTSAVW